MKEKIITGGKTCEIKLNCYSWLKDRALANPFYGSGTIPMEAALIGQNIAPGLNRDIAFTKWPGESKPSIILPATTLAFS
ncbi:hypothetical protein [Carboxydothermus pertinax]|uniref:hypothetical protein n=1 Tax=Carboxydothermus pertinax TaxID=870242 RepID=UPI000980A7D7|nr:hypothetical protein [Carboxydothermus pertinax]